MPSDGELPIRIHLGPWRTGGQYLREHLRAVQSAARIYGDCEFVPPTALAARALREFFASGRLPAGTVHASQELESLRPVRTEEQLDCFATLTRRRPGKDWQTIIAQFTIQDSEGKTVLKGKTVVVVPSQAAAPL